MHKQAENATKTASIGYTAANMIPDRPAKAPGVCELGSNDKLITGEPTTNDFFVCQRFLMVVLQ
jgi:hypothetical protein